jgi:hypothetical protein
MPLRRSTVRGREFGDAIRALLRAADLMGWREAKVSELVNGKDGSSDLELAQLLGLCRTPPTEFTHLVALYHETSEKDWLQRKTAERDPRPVADRRLHPAPRPGVRNTR